jgi:hypothetical protein
VAHRLALGRGEAGDVADDRLGDVGRMKSAARSSASPPISPIMTMASVSGSSWKACRQSMCVVPMTGSPPMPTQVENPMSRSSYIIW